MYNTEILNIEDDNHLIKAVEFLKKGELVAIPTETVYGLAADAKNKEAVEKIFKVKQRPANHPLIVHIASSLDLPFWAERIPPTAYLLAEHFWPGPLTIVLLKKSSILDEVSGGLATIALRVPNQLQVRAILENMKTGLVAPSANPHKKLSPTQAIHVYQSLYGKIPAVLDGGSCEVGIESTIIDLTQSIPTILRKGPISKERIEEVLNQQVHDPISHKISSPGNMKEHYQPNTKSLLVDLKEITTLLNQKDLKKRGLLYYSDISPPLHLDAIRLCADEKIYGASLYDALYQLDQLKLDEILIERLPEERKWAHVQDRLEKATFTS